MRILERYELDKPILMQDKLDIIWDKAKVQAPQETVKLLSAEEQYQKVLKETTMTYEEAMANKLEEQAKKIRAMEELHRLQKESEEDNVNMYSVKKRLG